VAEFAIRVHDAPPPQDAAVIDAGIGAYNAAAAPLHDVQPLSCFAQDAAGQVVGGAVGRRWGTCCELQQLWVHDALRGQGLGARLLHTFEQRAVAHGCTVLYLETFSFQAPQFYTKRGYAVEIARSGYTQGIVKFALAKQLNAA
jgi:GNAT superfamily N-acetyltransferase